MRSHRPRAAAKASNSHARAPRARQETGARVEHANVDSRGAAATNGKLERIVVQRFANAAQ
eukprot:8559863-Lingulodinium_polyedra.AAC.1